MQTPKMLQFYTEVKLDITYQWLNISYCLVSKEIGYPTPNIYVFHYIVHCISICNYLQIQTQ